MTRIDRFFAPLLLTGLLTAYTPLTQADMQQQGYGDMSYTAAPRIDKSQPTTYGGKVGRKASSAFANLTTGWLEIPKNMINTSNQSNVFYGIVGGLFKGVVNMAGRLGVGVADLITIPIPTKPIAYPVYIWEDFDVDTSYGDVFRLDTTEAPPAKPIAVAEPAAPVVAPPSAPAPAYEYNKETKKTLDNYFKKEMMK
jgi:putative exosortase-associated protein (TIGR04073 family)